MTRRTLLTSLAAAATLRAESSSAMTTPPHRTQPPAEWKPKLGVLGPYTPANVEFAKTQGFTNMILGVGRHGTLDAETVTDAQIESVKATLQKYDMHVSAFQIDGNHIAPDPEQRARQNAYFVKTSELAGKLGVPYLGTQSGKDPSKPFQEQVDEIVRVYHDKYFAACERNHVRILWEPYPEAA
ncbi:MAG: TIM barrel protein, partial [Acidobacteriaceae bacterium]|nr:TIM barrel protein [Acidobacteriaceae bacterium]